MSQAAALAESPQDRLPCKSSRAFDEEQFMEYVPEGQGLRQIGKRAAMPYKRDVWNLLQGTGR